MKSYYPPRTTVIGSYPIFPKPEEVSQYRVSGSLDEGLDPFSRTVELVVKDFLSAGVEIPATGQTREHFVRMFLDPRHVDGIQSEDSEIVVTGKIRRRSSIRKEDVQHARRFLPPYFEFKEPITGPYTLARSCRLKGRAYPDLRSLAFDMEREVCLAEALDLEKEVDLIQFDEPYLSIDPWRDYMVELYRELTESLKVPVVLHVCGDSIHVFKELTKLPVDILSLDFTYNQNLLDEVARRKFNQKIGFGCVSSGSPIVESVASIRRVIEEGIKKVGGERISLIHPGCGQRSLPLDSAYSKNVNMVLARNEVFYGEPLPAQAKPMRADEKRTRAYFLIQTDNGVKEIIVSLNSQDHKPMVRLRSTNAEKILYTIVDMKLFGETSDERRHLAHLGYEIGKAEAALKSNQPYRQERPLALPRKRRD